MKKLFSLSLLVAAIVIIGFSACKPPTPPTPPTPTGPTTQECDFYYLFLTQESASKGIYQLALMEKGMVGEAGKILKDGKAYVFNLVSDINNDKFTPALGEYTIVPKEQLNNTFQAAQCAYFTVNTQGENTGAGVTFANGGKIIMEANKISFKGKDVIGNELDLVYNGSYTGNDKRPNPWKGEPENPETIEFTATEFSLNEFNEVQGYKYFLTGTKPDANQKSMSLQIYVANSDDKTKIPDGSYPVKKEIQKGENAVMASKGGVSQMGQWLYYYSFVESGEKVFFIDSGMLIVNEAEENKMLFTGQSHFGSTITVLYTGSLNVVEQSAGAPQRAMPFLK